MSACSYCEKNKLQLNACNGCKAVSYCDEKCQKNDWNKHKPTCKILQIVNAEKGNMKIGEKHDSSVELDKHDWKTWPDRSLTVEDARVNFQSKDALSNAIQIILDKVTAKRALRTTDPVTGKVKKGSSLTEDRRKILEAAFTELLDMIGLWDVKTTIVHTVLFQMLNKFGGDVPPKDPMYNWIFFGNPGTGKTVAAALLGKLLSYSGIIEKPTVEDFEPFRESWKQGKAGDDKPVDALFDLLVDESIESEPGEGFIRSGRHDFTAGFEGQTESRAVDILLRSLGRTILIDEAYGLVTSIQDGIGRIVLNTIITFATLFPTKLSIILAGYEPDIRANLFKTNSGLESRFTNNIIFPFFDINELSKIFMQSFDIRKTQVQSYTLSLDLKENPYEFLRKLFNTYQKRFKNSNGRAVNALLDGAIKNHFFENLQRFKMSSRLNFIIDNKDLETVIPFVGSEKSASNPIKFDDVIYELFNLSISNGPPDQLLHDEDFDTEPEFEDEEEGIDDIDLQRFRDETTKINIELIEHFKSNAVASEILETFRYNLVWLKKMNKDVFISINAVNNIKNVFHEFDSLDLSLFDQRMVKKTHSLANKVLIRTFLKRIEFHVELIIQEHIWDQDDIDLLRGVKEAIFETKWYDARAPVGLFDKDDIKTPRELKEMIIAVIRTVIPLENLTEDEKKTKISDFVTLILATTIRGAQDAIFINNWEKKYTSIQPKQRVRKQAVPVPQVMVLEEKKEKMSEEKRLDLLTYLFYVSLKFKRVFIGLSSESRERYDLYEPFMAIVASIDLFDMFETKGWKKKSMSFITTIDNLVDGFLGSHPDIKVSDETLSDPNDFSQELENYVLIHIKSVLNELEKRGIDPDVIRFEETYDKDKVDEFLNSLSSVKELKQPSFPVSTGKRKVRATSDSKIYNDIVVPLRIRMKDHIKLLNSVLGFKNKKPIRAAGKAAIKRRNEERSRNKVSQAKENLRRNIALHKEREKIRVQVQKMEQKQIEQLPPKQKVIVTAERKVKKEILEDHMLVNEVIQEEKEKIKSASKKRKRKGKAVEIIFEDFYNTWLFHMREHEFDIEVEYLTRFISIGLSDTGSREARQRLQDASMEVSKAITMKKDLDRLKQARDIIGTFTFFFIEANNEEAKRITYLRKIQLFNLYSMEILKLGEFVGKNYSKIKGSYDKNIGNIGTSSDPVGEFRDFLTKSSNLLKRSSFMENSDASNIRDKVIETINTFIRSSTPTFDESEFPSNALFYDTFLSSNLNSSFGIQSAISFNIRRKGGNKI